MRNKRTHKISTSSIRHTVTYTVPPALTAATEVTTTKTFRWPVHLLRVRDNKPTFFAAGTNYSTRVGKIQGFACTIYTIDGVDYEQI